MKIVGYCNFNGVGVPQGEDGRYLDWQQISRDEAPALTSPWGPLHFFIGNEERKVCLDFAELPTGDLIIDITGDTHLLTYPHFYLVEPTQTVLSEVWVLTECLLADLEAIGVTHDFECFGSDPFYFWRALASHLGRPSYASMADYQLRSEDPVPTAL